MKSLSLLLFLVITISFCSSFIVAELDNYLVDPPRALSENNNNNNNNHVERKSPSFFAAVRQETGQDRQGEIQGAFEDGIVRTSGTFCVQVSGSSTTCDLCCDGTCCENPNYWTKPVPEKSNLDNAQAWIPIRFVFVVPTSYTLSSLPSEASLRELIGKVNTAYARSAFRVLYNGYSVLQNNTLWNQCATDPCFTDTNCGFLKILLPAVNASVDTEIAVTTCHGINYLGEAQFAWGAPQYQYLELQLAGMLGPALVHELGHYLGLMHVFEGSCASQGDWVSDTNAASQASTVCGQVKDSCSTLPGDDPTQNYMNYGLQWGCGLAFTDGQFDRARRATQYYRQSLIKNTRVMLNVSNLVVGGTTTANASAANGSSSLAQIPGCSVNAQTFQDCWCETPQQNPADYCRTVGSYNFTPGPTLAPASPAGVVSISIVNMLVGLVVCGLVTML